MAIAEITIDNIKKNFNKFNKMFFDNSLQTPQFVIRTNKTSLGVCRFKRNIIANIVSTSITISDYYALEDVEFENTIIHEMIHLWEYQNYGTSGHGTRFKQKARLIAMLSNNKYIIERTASISKLSKEGEERLAKTSQRQPIYCIAIERSTTGIEFAWIFKMSNKLYNQVFFDGGLNLRNFEVVGWHYKHIEGLNIRECRTSIHGKKMFWEEFCHKYNDVVCEMTKKHKTLNVEYRQQIFLR